MAAWDPMRTLLVTLACLVLPASHRDPLVRKHGVNAPFWSFLLGLVEMPLGFLLYFSFGMAFMSKLGLGILGWISYHLTPQAWLFAVLTVTGFFRIAEYLLNKQAVGEIPVWAVIRAHEAIRRRKHRQRVAREFAPEHLPDRLFEEGDGRLAILCARQKEDWDELVTIKVGERFYRLVGVEERKHGSWKVVAHVLEELDENEPIRRLVHADVEVPAAAAEPHEG